MTWSRLWRVFALALAAFVGSSLSPAAGESPSARTDRQILVMVRHPPDHYRANGAYGGGYGDELARSARERVARGIAHKYGLSFVEEWPMSMIGVDCFVMLVPDDRSTSTAAEQVSHDADVSWAEPVQRYTAQGVTSHAPNDPLFAAEPAALQWHLADLHRLATGRGTRVAVIDSGIDDRHPDLAGQVAINRNFVSGQPLVAEQHGTAVAGIIGAKDRNRLGIVGVAPGSRLLGLRACWQSRTSTACDTLSLAKALYFAIENRADVINLSLSGPDARLLRELLKIASVHDVAVVAAFDPNLPGGGFPASVPGVIAVSDAPVAGPHHEVYIAPGRDVPTTQPGGRWFLVNGSSFAAAHVSGLVALIRERHHSAQLAFVPGLRGGTIDACATLVRSLGACDCACGPRRSAAGGNPR